MTISLREWACDDPALTDPVRFRETVALGGDPVVIRNYAREWPLLQAAQISDHAACDYLRRHDSGKRPQVMLGDPAIEGRYFYRDGLDGFNFERIEMGLGEALQRMLDRLIDATLPSAYLGSLVAPAYLPGMVADHQPALMPPGVAMRLWIGNESHVACHYDAYENFACVLAGRRRFTLYPPDAISDLYVGPIDFTLAGQPVSIAAADRDHPERYPRFARAEARKLVVDLAPGDALYLPKLWWHQVEATAPFNIMANFWWDAFAIGPDAPMLAMLFAMITLGERPQADREAFRAYFDHFVFRPNGHPLAHLPEEKRGVLRDLAGGGYGQIRAMIMRALRGQ